MKIKFNAMDTKSMNVSLFFLTPGFLMMSISFFGTSGLRLVFGILLGAMVLIYIWVGFVCGSYTTIDTEKKVVYGTIFFIKAKVVSLSDIISIKSRGAFAGLMTRVYMIYYDKNGNIKNGGLLTKESLTKEDFKKFIDTIKSINPSIEINPSIFSE